MQIIERKLTDTEIQKVNGIVKNMLKNKRALVSKYGAEAEKVMYGRAINMVKKATNMDIEKLNELIKDVLKRPIVKNLNEYRDEGEENGLNLVFNNVKDYTRAKEVFQQSDLYFEDEYPSHFFFKEDPENYDELEKVIQDILNKNNLNGYIEGVWNESLKENKTQIDSLLKILNTKKAGNEYKKALMDLIKLAEKKSGKTINTKKEALLALDYIEPTIHEEEDKDKIDVISMDVPLFIRALEYAKEDAETDMDLHDFSERAVSGTKEKGVLTMEDYGELVGESEISTPKEKINELDTSETFKTFLKKHPNAKITTKKKGNDIIVYVNGETAFNKSDHHNASNWGNALERALKASLMEEQEYAKDIEVQADEEEEYQKLKQNLNNKKLSEIVFNKLKDDIR